MYKNGFVVNVIHKGEILEDTNGTVAIPFNAEYEVKLKNKNSRDAVAKVFIDGREVTKAGDIIVRENQSVNLERFLDSLYDGRKFKFVPLEKGESGDNEKGIVEVRFRMVKERSYGIVWNPPREVHHYHHPVYIEKPYWSYPNVTYCDQTGPSVSTTTKGLDSCYSNTSANANIGNAFYCSSSPNVKCANISDVDSGKTVEGGYSGQKFSYDYIGDLESSETVVRLKIVGFKSKEDDHKVEVMKQIDELQKEIDKLRQRI